MTELDTNALRAHLVDFVREEAGIQLHERDIAARLDGQDISIACLGAVMATLPFEPDELDERDLAVAALEQVDDLRRWLTNRRVDAMQPWLEVTRARVGAALAESGVKLEPEALAIESGVPPVGMHGATDRELDTGYLGVRLVIAMPSGADVDVVLDPYCPEEPADVEAIVEAVLSRESGA